MNRLFGLLLLMLSLDCTAQAPLRVGVYPTDPGVVLTEQGGVTGHYVEVLNVIAEREQWQLVFVHAPWSALLDKLEADEVDLIVGAAYTPARAQLYDFNQETIFSNWAQLFARDNQIQSILDLSGSRIAGEDLGFYTLELAKRLKRFGIRADVIGVDSFDDALLSVVENRADVAIVPRSAVNKVAQQYPLQLTPVICCPSEVRYLASKGEQGGVLARIDHHLRQMKANNQSFFYQSLQRWMQREPRLLLPQWLLPTLLVLLAMALLLGAGVLVLRSQVNKRTDQLQRACADMENRVRLRTIELSDTNDALHREVAQHQAAQQQLRHLAQHDALTGLPNRRHFSNLLEQELKRVHRSVRPLVVMFLGLDGFKQVNDNFGHDVGDRVLVECSARLKLCLREIDQLARLGGDEFVVMLTEVGDPRDGAVVAQKIISAMAKPMLLKGHSCQLGVSIGVSHYPAHGYEVDQLLSKADQAMYRAKQAGKNRYVEFDH
ncbi:MAG: GGDEF domain-containing protein [Halopseudomonas sp.]